MADNWCAEEYARVSALWEAEKSDDVSRARETWNERAIEWEKGLRTDDEWQRSSNRRIDAVMELLRAHGLPAGCDVIDIGCGPGRFVARLAQRARFVLGTDLSPKMTGYGERYCREQGLENAEFAACDFAAADIDALGWRRRFDLVFASITPAIGTAEGFSKAKAMSRGSMLLCLDVQRTDSLFTELARDVAGSEPPAIWDGRQFYCIFNQLWLSGYNPQITYYHERSENRIGAERTMAKRYASWLFGGEATEEQDAEVFAYMNRRADVNGDIAHLHDRLFGFIFVDLRERAPRV